jgi:AcrR family transcriptional regulator
MSEALEAPFSAPREETKQSFICFLCMTKKRRKLGRPPNAEGRNTRERILEVALELFAAHGFTGTSVRQLASAAGITEGAIYAHFPGKQEIFQELFREAGPAVVISTVQHPQLDDDEPAAFVRQVVEEVLSKWSEPRARKFMGVILRECTLDAKTGAPSLNEEIAEALKQVGRIFRRWANDGLLRGDFPAEHLVWELFAPLINLRLMYLHPNATEAEIRSAKTAGQRHVEYFLSSALRTASKVEKKDEK